MRQDIIQNLTFFEYNYTTVVLAFSFYGCITTGIGVDSASVAVESGDEEYAQPPPIVYGEPVYLPPPIAVAYPYDYYTYENDGGYVNIVFFSGGVRHVEMWHDRGVRMTSNHYNQWRGRSENRIHRDKFDSHRQALEKNHGIKHPDSHYGVRPRTTKGSQPGHPQPGHKVTPQTQKGHPQPGRVQQPSKASQTQRPAPAVRKTTPQKPAPQKAAPPRKAAPNKKDEEKKK